MNDHDAGPSAQIVGELQMPFCAKVLVLFVLVVIVHTLKDPFVRNTPSGSDHSDNAGAVDDHQWTSTSVHHNPDTATVLTADQLADTSVMDINQRMPSVGGDQVTSDKTTTTASILEDFRGVNSDEQIEMYNTFSKTENLTEDSIWRPTENLHIDTASNYLDYRNTLNKTKSVENSTPARSSRHSETRGYTWQQWRNTSLYDISDFVLRKRSQSAPKYGTVSRSVTAGIAPSGTQTENGGTPTETDNRDTALSEPGGAGPAPRHPRQTSGSLPVPATNRRHIRAWQEGDAIIGALFPIHKAPLQKNAYARQCGPVWETYGIQRVETFIMTVERINSDPSILPNMKLGWDIRDSCWYSAIALENSIDFIKDAIASQSIYSSPEQSNSTDPETTTTASPVRTTRQPPTSSSTTGWRDSYDSLTCRSPKHMKPIIGLVGPGSSESTIQVQNLLQIFNIPQIGYSATSLDLSDKNHYRYFLRVVPPDNNQAQVLVDILLTFNWTYVSTVYSEGNYGLKGMSKFTELAKSKGICIAETGNVASTSEDGKPFDEVLEKLLVNPNASVVVCFCEGNTVHKLFKATRRRGMERRLLIIGSDGWGNRLDVVEGVEEAAAGSISIMLYSPPFKDFRPYYDRLKPYRSPKNPWFQEFWEYKFDCSLDKNNMRGYAKLCTGNESLVGSEEDSKLGFVVNAVTALARGLHNMREALCPGSQGLCPAMEPLNGSVYLGHLLKVRFNSYSGDPVHFNQEGDPPARYDILNYQPTNKVDINGSRTYEYVTIGHWASGNLSLNHPKIYWPPGPAGARESGQVLTSVCSEPCKWNEAQQKVKGVPCCWICTLCLENEILVDNNTECVPCNRGQMPNRNKTACEDIPVDFISWSNTQALVSVSLASLGVGVTLWVLVTFVRYHNTPVVKASTRELSYILLVGICLAFGSNYFIVAKPGKEVCYLTRILPGLSFSLMYGALVTRTNRIARILEGSKRIMTKKPKFMSATAQVVITGIIIGIESAVIAAMLIYQPADSVLDYPAPKRVRLICDTSTLGIVAPLGFDLVLIILCTIYAVKTRNLPENFNEAKFIGFTMYATCVIWLGFFPIYFAGDNKELTLCLSMSLSAAIALVLLFLPKVYVIVWVPEKNTRGAFATSRDVRCHIGSKSMNSGDSMDIKESSTYDCLLKADKGQVRPWRQKLLDEKHLRFMMQRSTYSEEDTPYINHGVLSNHCPPSGNKTLPDRNSKDSYRSESTTVSGQSGQEKDRVHPTDHNRDSNGAGVLRKPLERDQANHKNHLPLRPGSPAEKGRYRIQNISQTIGPQDLLQLRTFCEIGPIGRSGDIRKSLSSTCVSSSQHSASVSCQTSDDLVDFLLPPLRRRHMSKSKNKLERSEAVDDPAAGTTNNQKGPREKVVKYSPQHDPGGPRMYHSGNHLEIPDYGPRRGLNHNSHIHNFRLPPDLDREDSWSSVGCEDLNQRRHSHNVTASSRSLTATMHSPRRCSQDSAPASPFLPSPYASLVSSSPSKPPPRFSQNNAEKPRDQHSRASSSSCSVVNSAQSSPMHLVPNAITTPRLSSNRDLKMSSSETLQEHGWQRDSSETPPPEDSFSSTALSITSSSSFTLPPFHGSSDSLPSQETFDEVEEEFESSQSFLCSDINSYHGDSNRTHPRTPDLEDTEVPPDDVLEFQKVPQDDVLEFQKVPQDDVLEFQKYLQGHGVQLILSSVQSSDL